MSLLSLSFLIQCSIHFVNDDPNYRKPMILRGGATPLIDKAEQQPVSIQSGQSMSG